MHTLRLISGSGLAAIAAALVACGGGNDAAPTLIKGGGVGSGSIAGTLHVYVIDNDTGAPISGAKVNIGGGAFAGTTDATGLYTAKSDSLQGHQDIAAVADGHVPTLWVGANGANVTIPVAPTSTSTQNIPQAELDATLGGWDAFNPLATADALIGIVSYTHTTDIGAPENNLPQPAGPVAQLPQITGNMCVKAQVASPTCAPKVNARTGRVALLATITNRNFNGTPTNTADDVVTVLGYSVQTGITVDNGVKQTGLALTQIPAGDLGMGSIDFGTPPAALTSVQGIIGVDLGQDGIAEIPNPLTPASHTMLVPKPSAITGATYRVTALATTTATNAPQSIVLKRGLTDASSMSVGTWLATPTGIMASGDNLSFTMVDGSNLSGYDITAQGASSPAWTVTILDPSGTAHIPSDVSPFPTGQVTIKATAIDATINTADFNLADKFDLINRLSSDSVTVTR